MKFTLPLPISVNAMYRSGYSRKGYMARFKTKEAVQWQHRALQEIMVQRVRQVKPPKITGIEVWFYRIDNRRFDCGNHTKLLYDTFVLSGIVKDDNDFTDEHLHKRKAERAYCEVFIT